MTDYSRRRFLVGTGLSTTGLLAGPWASADAEEAVSVTPDQPGNLWAWVRRQFNLISDRVLMTGFYMASHPKCVRDAIARYRDELDANPYEGHTSKEVSRMRRVRRSGGLPRRPVGRNSADAEHHDGAYHCLSRHPPSRGR